MWVQAIGGTIGAIAGGAVASLVSYWVTTKTAEGIREDERRERSAERLAERRRSEEDGALFSLSAELPALRELCEIWLVGSTRAGANMEPASFAEHWEKAFDRLIETWDVVYTRIHGDEIIRAWDLLSAPARKLTLTGSSSRLPEDYTRRVRDAAEVLEGLESAINAALGRKHRPWNLPAAPA